MKKSKEILLVLINNRLLVPITMVLYNEIN